ncbi:MAG: hypothetical protein AAGD32_11175 [Planctomycetota bacterium]
MDIDYAPGDLKTSPPRTVLRMAGGMGRWCMVRVGWPVVVWTLRVVCYLVGAMSLVIAWLALRVARLRWHHVRSAAWSLRLRFIRTRNRLLDLNPWREVVPTASLVQASP